jgi:hypothetical protein
MLIDAATATMNASTRALDQGARVVVLYDGGCSLCKLLANFSRERMRDVTDVVFSPNAEPNPKDLVVQIRDDGVITTMTGRNAWSWLLEHHPSLRQVHWLAAKLGLTAEVSATMRRSADFLRKFCLRCR